MTLGEWSAEYCRLRALAVRAAYDNNPALLSMVGEKLRALPSFHYEHKKEE